MTELLTPAQMRAIEDVAMTREGIAGADLMERAAEGVVEAALQEWPELEHAAPRAVVLCGPGNNGGDGFAIARLLAGRGWTIDLYFYGKIENLPKDARSNADQWARLGEIRPLTHEALEGLADDHRPVGFVIDALFGIGLTRPFEDAALVERAAELARALAGPAGMRLVSVDLPSGLCGERGYPLGGVAVAAADLTVTFHCEKLGHRLGQGPEVCGAVRVVDIGLEEAAQRYRSGLAAAKVPQRQTRLLERWVVAPDVDGTLGKSARSHKFDHGHLLVLSGGWGAGGAARLAARGGLRIGAGLVTIAVPPDAVAENAAQLSAIMLAEISGSDALEDLLAEDPRISALCIGPGLGLGEGAADLVRIALTSGRRIVLDADAITLLARSKDLRALLHEGCLLTPHGGEFARLFPDLGEALRVNGASGPAMSKVAASREAAVRLGCTILFKGADTVICDARGDVSINSAAYGRAAPWLATAGSGDVLAGFAAGLMARGHSPKLAAERAAWLHVECARDFGPGLIAEDLPEALPRVFRALGL